MKQPKISGGVVHTLPKDLEKILITHPKVLAVWEDITPLARNEWICWVESVKKIETRERHLRILTENLLRGKRRPCCWAGCTHR